MNKRDFVCFLILLCSTTGTAQRRPDVLEGSPPAPAPDRIEVRFALGDKALQCKRFQLLVKSHGLVLIDGKFSSGFKIPEKAKSLLLEDALDITISCGMHRWHFRDAPERVFLWGWWWVGTDYPPYQRTLQDTRRRDSIWIDYLIVDPIDDSGFYLYHNCPASMRNQKPGPCYPSKLGWNVGEPPASEKP